jgi:hypothetical protein
MRCRGALRGIEAHFGPEHAGWFWLKSKAAGVFRRLGKGTSDSFRERRCALIDADLVDRIVASPQT